MPARNLHQHCQVSAQGALRRHFRVRGCDQDGCRRKSFFHELQLSERHRLDATITVNARTRYTASESDTSLSSGSIMGKPTARRCVLKISRYIGCDLHRTDIRSNGLLPAQKAPRVNATLAILNKRRAAQATISRSVMTKRAIITMKITFIGSHTRKAEKSPLRKASIGAINIAIGAASAMKRRERPKKAADKPSVASSCTMQIRRFVAVVLDICS